MIWMEAEGASSWRARLWEAMLNSLPARVTLDLNAGAYNVRDGSNAYVYADDLEREEYDEIIAEWAEALSPEDAVAFYRRFCLKRIEACRIERTRELRYAALGESARALPVRVRAEICLERAEPCVEFRFERAFDGGGRRGAHAGGEGERG